MIASPVQWVKDLGLPELWLRFNPWHRNFRMLQVWPLKKEKREKKEFPLRLSRLRTRLVSMRMWVRPLALLSGLRIQCCCELQHRLRMQLRSGMAVVVAVV